jgi:hypothetical protein
MTPLDILGLVADLLGIAAGLYWLYSFLLKKTNFGTL